MTNNNNNNQNLNMFYQTINECCENLSDNEIEHIIKKFNKLNWNGIINYYNISGRKNLLEHKFILWKIITSSKKSQTIQNKFIYNNINKYDNGLQNMLWEILNPDLAELS